MRGFEFYIRGLVYIFRRASFALIINLDTLQVRTECQHVPNALIKILNASFHVGLALVVLSVVIAETVKGPFCSRLFGNRLSIVEAHQLLHIVIDILAHLIGVFRGPVQSQLKRSHSVI